MVARSIHDNSERKDSLFVKADCARQSSNFIDSEFFGHEKNAFTGTYSQKIGEFEFADGGTIFLDEVGELPMELQGRLLRVIEDEEFERVGGNETVHVNVRVIAATNRNLKHMIGIGEFREDLYHRLNVFEINNPSLLERFEDLNLLVPMFVEKYAKKVGKTIKSIPSDVYEAIKAYHWPGNIRELRNALFSAVILSENCELSCENILELSPTISVGKSTSADAIQEHLSKSFPEVEKEMILGALKRCNWVNDQASNILDIPSNTLRDKINKYIIQELIDNKWDIDRCAQTFEAPAKIVDSNAKKHLARTLKKQNWNLDKVRDILKIPLDVLNKLIKKYNLNPPNS